MHYRECDKKDINQQLQITEQLQTVKQQILDFYFQKHHILFLFDILTCVCKESGFDLFFHVANKMACVRVRGILKGTSFGFDLLDTQQRSDKLLKENIILGDRVDQYFKTDCSFQKICVLSCFHILNVSACEFREADICLKTLQVVFFLILLQDSSR